MVFRGSRPLGAVVLSLVFVQCLCIMATQSVYSCLQSLLFACLYKGTIVNMTLSLILRIFPWLETQTPQPVQHLLPLFFSLVCKVHESWLSVQVTDTHTCTHTQTQTRSCVTHNNAASLHYHCQGLARSSNILMARVMKLASFEPFFTHFTPHICWSFNIVIICYTTKCKFMLVIL